MKIGLLSDIHGNWEALEIALSILESEGVDKLHCIGDIVGYGADPAVCIDQIERKCEKIVAGNHDWASIGKTDIMYFNMFGRKAILWTSRILAPHQKSFLAELPLYNACDNFCIVHSTPIEPSQWHYVLTSAQAMHQFEHFSQKICFIGHSHTPMLFSENGNLSRVAILQ
ncbi:hypothetical protein DRQ33_01590 [bacterium]|nr:MAG: hypothetical protein DRQ33_01590 [bacterium]